jgi:hypothetical protein
MSESSTDVIISGYENKINQNIASKTIAASKSGKSPEFTKEELLYLNRKAEENEDTELKVITPIPDITLKKGKTELNIGHAVKLVQKMEEKYPTGVSKDQADFINAQPYIAKSIEYGLNQVSSSTLEAGKSLETLDILVKSINQKEDLLRSEQPPIKTVNSNAYEIRNDILAKALSWVQYKKEFETLKVPPTEDEVIEVAQRFYKFVENRR